MAPALITPSRYFSSTAGAPPAVAGAKLKRLAVMMMPTAQKITTIHICAANSESCAFAAPSSAASPPMANNTIGPKEFMAFP